MKNLVMDEINKNILQTLLRNGRATFSEMAKENKITTSSVKSRYENLKKSGVINGAIMMVNPEKIGLNCYGFLGIKVNSENRSELRKILNKQPYCLATWNRLQDINLGCFFALPSFKHFTHMLDQLKTNSYIERIQPLINAGTPIDIHPENLVIRNDFEIDQQPLFEKLDLNLENEARKASKKKYIDTLQLKKMKKKDRQITKILSQNARISFSKIAKRLDLSIANVSRTYKKLINNKVLLKSSITVNLRKLGFQANVMIFIKASIGSDVTDIQRTLLKRSNVIALNKTMGDWDIFATIPIRFFKDFFEIGQEFRKIKGIKIMQFDLNPPFSRWPSHLFHYVL